MAVTLISRDDLARATRKFRSRAVPQVVRKLTPHDTRVIDHWNTRGVEAQWFDVPEVLCRWNRMISGDGTIDFPNWVAQRHRLKGRALSLGCGFGERELAWAELGAFDELVGIDIAPRAVQHANELAQAAGFSPSRLRFEMADEQLSRGGWNAILALHSLHHFDQVRRTIQQVAAALQPSGLFIMDEYVGPSRFQWTRRQVREADCLLRSLPPERRMLRDGRVKSSVRRPSLLAMRLDDPSEAVESAAILPAIHDTFTTLDERGYGGALLHPLLSNIAQHFVGGDEETSHLLRELFAAEDDLLARGVITHDFVAGVYRPATG